MKIIMLPRGGVIKLSESLGVSRITIWKALTFRTENKLSHKIRTAAVKCGGQIYEPSKNTQL